MSQEFHRVSICRYGTVVVPGKTLDELKENIKGIREADISWEPLSADLLQEEMSDLGVCNENGALLNKG